MVNNKKINGKKVNNKATKTAQKILCSVYDICNYVLFGRGSKEYCRVENSSCDWYKICERSLKNRSVRGARI
jgi:hypothetical protein